MPSLARIETLEGRALLSSVTVPLGDGFRASTNPNLGEQSTVSDWRYTREPRAVAADPAGNFVVVWHRVPPSYSPDISSNDVYARRFDASGNPLGDAFSVEPSPAPDIESSPSVAVAANGTFIIAWARDGIGSEAGTGGIYAMRYDAEGNPLGEKLAISTWGHDVHFERSTAVAMDDDGDFAVAWHRYREDGSGYGVYARSYRSDGTPRGEEFRVHTDVEGDQTAPVVAMDADGDMVVAWQSKPLDPTSESDVFARRFDESGNPLGLEFRVNDFTDGVQYQPTVAMDDEGGFVVAWAGLGPLESGALGGPIGVHAKRYDASGAALGSQFRVGMESAKSFPAVAMDADGDFVVTWRDWFSAVSGQVFSSSGTPLGSEFRVNQTAGQESFASVAMDDRGEFVVAWTHALAYGSGNVYARRFRAADDPAPPAEVVGRHVFYNGSVYDGKDPNPSVADERAIAPDKQALLPGQSPSPSNVTSYTKGINGIIIEVRDQMVRPFSFDDLDFDVSSGVDHGSWVPAPSPWVIAASASPTPEGPVRVTIVWENGAIINEWLRVTVKSTSHTGLAAPDVFYFGSLVGETGDSATPLRVSAVDALAVRRNLYSASPLMGRYDFDRNGKVTAADLAMAARNLNRSLPSFAGMPTPKLFADERTSSQRLAAEVLA